MNNIFKLRSNLGFDFMLGEVIVLCIIEIKEEIDL